jgi:hypothetical protein
VALCLLHLLASISSGRLPLVYIKDKSKKQPYSPWNRAFKAIYQREWKEPSLAGTRLGSNSDLEYKEDQHTDFEFQDFPGMLKDLEFKQTCCVTSIEEFN